MRAALRAVYRSAGGPGRLRTHRLKETTAGVVFFSRTGDVSTGEWDDAVIIDQAGEFPNEFLELAAA